MQNGGQRSAVYRPGRASPVYGSSGFPASGVMCKVAGYRTLFKEILEHAAANGGTRSGRPTARSLFQLTPNEFSLFAYVFER